MNKCIRILFFVTGSFYLSICAASSNTSPSSPATVNVDKAVVYIYRPTAMTNALYSPAININGEFKFQIKNGMSTRLSLSAGDYLFSFQAEKTYAELSSLALTLKPGATYFIRVTTSLSINTSTDYQPYTRSFKLSLVEKTRAEKEISECCAADDKKLTTTTEPDINKRDAEEGFSVDKTQNPFSH